MYELLLSLSAILAIIVILFGTIYASAKIGKCGQKAHKGKRFKKFVPFNGNFEEVQELVIGFLGRNEFIFKNYGDEQVFKQGHEIFTIFSRPRYVKITQDANGFNFEAWYIGVGILGPKEKAFDTLEGNKEKYLKQIIKRCIDIVTET